MGRVISSNRRAVLLLRLVPRMDREACRLRTPRLSLRTGTTKCRRNRDRDGATFGTGNIYLWLRLALIDLNHACDGSTLLGIWEGTIVLVDIFVMSAGIGAVSQNYVFITVWAAGVMSLDFCLYLSNNSCDATPKLVRLRQYTPFRPDCQILFFRVNFSKPC